MKQNPALMELASVMHSVHYEDLPPSVVQDAKALILDTLGCAFGGFAADVSKAVRAMAEELGASAGLNRDWHRPENFDAAGCARQRHDAQIPRQ